MNLRGIYVILFHIVTLQGIQGRECEFDKEISGQWFQSGRGDRPALRVNRTHFSEGRCVEVGKANRFLVYLKHEKCHKCMVINMKHHNIIQYKESYCDPSSSDLIHICHGITGDATLFTMFRMNAKPMKCPFSGPLTFTYSKGYGECTNPVSQVDSCADESRLLFRQQACADVPKSESKEEELQCLGVWKDGSNRYLAGKINHSHANTPEDRYRCFIYEKPHSRQHRHYVLNEARDAAVWYLSVSADATCQGLVSANEGSKTMKLKKANHAGKKCKFPSWLSKQQHLHTLDFSQSYFLYHHNTSLKISNGTKAFESLEVRGQTEIRLVCHQYDSYTDPRDATRDNHVTSKNHHDHSNEVTIVVHFTQACRSGYKCMRMHRRDNHVVEMQFGQDALTPDEACNSFYWQPSQSSYQTLIGSHEQSVGCGALGKYSIAATSKDTSCSATNPAFSKLTIGCSHFNTLQLHSQCPRDSTETYQCHSEWETDNVKYIIASPVSRASGGPRRVCFSYRPRHLGQSGDIVFTTRHDTCSSQLHDAQMVLNATLIGQCVKASGISSGCWRVQGNNWVGLAVVLAVVASYLFDICEWDQKTRST